MKAYKCPSEQTDAQMLVVITIFYFPHRSNLKQLHLLIFSIQHKEGCAEGGLAFFLLGVGEASTRTAKASTQTTKTTS